MKQRLVHRHRWRPLPSIEPWEEGRGVGYRQHSLKRAQPAWLTAQDDRQEPQRRARVRIQD